MITELRKLFGVYLIDLTFWILPNGEFKKEFAEFMIKMSNKI